MGKAAAGAGGEAAAGSRGLGSSSSPSSDTSPWPATALSVCEKKCVSFLLQLVAPAVMGIASSEISRGPDRALTEVQCEACLVSVPCLEPAE